MTSTRRVDFRSDTVTQPTAEMRAAIASAEVGDDMYGEDPSVNALQERIADLLGKEAALFVPTGTMANQIAIKIQTQPGDSMLAGAQAHNWMFEAGGAAFISSVQVIILPGDGFFDGADVKKACMPDQLHFSPTRLVSLENTHTMGGGRIWDQDQVAEVQQAARSLGLSTHLDGARIWNAAAATGRTERDLADGFDTVSVCLSKGLGAPVGSLVCGSKALIDKAYRVRRVLGGSMRQSGILAAGGLYAIEHHRARLQQDHDNAGLLANALNGIEGISVDRQAVDTNIVFARVTDPAIDAHALVKEAGASGVLFYAIADDLLRLVTHLDVDRDDCARAAEVIDQAAGAARSA